MIYKVPKSILLQLLFSLTVLLSVISCNVNESYDTGKPQQYALKRKFVEKFTGCTIYNLQERKKKEYAGDLEYCIGEDYDKIFIFNNGLPVFVVTEQFKDCNDFLERSTILLYLDNCKLLAEGLKDIKNFTLRFAMWNSKDDEKSKIGVLFFCFDGNFYAISVSHYENDKLIKSQSETSEKRMAESHRSVLERLIQQRNQWSYGDTLNWDDYVDTFSDYLIRYGRPVCVYTEHLLTCYDLKMMLLNNSNCNHHFRGYDSLIEKFENVKDFTLRLAIWRLGGSKNEVIHVWFFLYNGEFYAISINRYDDKTKFLE